MFPLLFVPELLSFAFWSLLQKSRRETHLFSKLFPSLEFHISKEFWVVFIRFWYCLIFKLLFLKLSVLPLPLVRFRSSCFRRPFQVLFPSGPSLFRSLSIISSLLHSVKYLSAFPKFPWEIFRSRFPSPLVLRQLVYFIMSIGDCQGELYRKLQVFLKNRKFSLCFLPSYCS